MSGTKNTLGDMFNIFAEQLERLNDDSVSGEQLEAEIKRADAMAKVADPIIKIADIQYKAWATSLEYRHGGEAEKLPRLLEVKQ